MTVSMRAMPISTIPAWVMLNPVSRTSDAVTTSIPG